MTDASGDGWVFLVPEVAGTTATVTVGASGEIIATRDHGPAAAGAELEVSVIAMRTEGLSAAQLDAYVDPGASVSVRFAQMNRQGQLVETLASAEFEPERGVFVVDLDLLTNVGARRGPIGPTLQSDLVQPPPNRAREHRRGARLDPHRLRHGGRRDRVHHGRLRDAPRPRRRADRRAGPDLEELARDHQPAPLVPLLQHAAAPRGRDPRARVHRRLGELGQLLRGVPRPAFAHRLGPGPAVGRVGPGVLGGEHHLRPRPDPPAVDARRRTAFPHPEPGPGTTGRQRGRRRFFTFRAANGSRDRLGRLRSHYAAQGPNLTDVTYAGETQNGSVSATIRTRLGRTDDLVRAYYDLEYVFHESVSYSRLAFFQIAADNYSDNDFQSIAYGNADEVVHDGPAAPTGGVGYASANDRGVALNGDAPWVLLRDNQRTDGLREDVACVGFVIRDYRFESAGTTTTTPHVNIVNTNNWNQYPEVGFELGIPYDAASPTVPAGSVLRATIEYLVIPDDKALYYGPSADLLAIPSATFGTAEMMRVLAAGNRQEVQTSVGTLNWTHPIDITCASGSASRPGSRWTRASATWPPSSGASTATTDGSSSGRRRRLGLLGQEVEERLLAVPLDEMAQSYELTFNVEHDGQATYRLIRIDCDGDGVGTPASSRATRPWTWTPPRSPRGRGRDLLQPQHPELHRASGAMTVLERGGQPQRSPLTAPGPAQRLRLLHHVHHAGSVFPGQQPGNALVIGDIGCGVGGGIVNAGRSASSRSRSI